jgi:hypothetical protein
VAPKADLLRIAANPQGEEAVAVLDLDGKMPGRGAYLCRGSDRFEPAQPCLAQALRRKAIQRGLRRTVRVDFKLVESVGP